MISSLSDMEVDEIPWNSWEKWYIAIPSAKATKYTNNESTLFARVSDVDFIHPNIYIICNTVSSVDNRPKIKYWPCEFVTYKNNSIDYFTAARLFSRSHLVNILFDSNSIQLYRKERRPTGYSISLLASALRKSRYGAAGTSCPQSATYASYGSPYSRNEKISPTWPRRGLNRKRYRNKVTTKGSVLWNIPGR